MARRQDGRLELVLLGGFLGAGKTNYLRHQLHLGHYARHFLLINEAADVSVDDLLLLGGMGREILAGGCACCKEIEALKSALRRICNRLDRGELAGLEGVLLETSGLASLSRITRALAADPLLSQRIIVSENVVVVDGASAADQLRQEPLWLEQIEAADHLVITKAATAPDLARLWPSLQNINPSAKIEATEFGQILPLPEPKTPYDFSPAPDFTPIEAHSIALGERPDWACLSVWLSALIAAYGDSLHRVKGVIDSDAGPLLFQSVCSSVQAPERLPQRPETCNQLVFIGRGHDPQKLQASWSVFATPLAPI